MKKGQKDDCGPNKAGSVSWVNSAHSIAVGQATVLCCVDRNWPDVANEVKPIRRKKMGPTNNAN